MESKLKFGIINNGDIMIKAIATDLDGTFQKIASYLKKDGIFIFSWHHTLNYCIAWSCDQRKDVIEDDTLIMHKSYSFLCANVQK